MRLRFRKRIKIAPGIHINLSKSGISTSVGVKGASVTYGQGKKRTNLGIPGSGLSINTVERVERAQSAESNGQISTLEGAVVIVLKVIIGIVIFGCVLFILYAVAISS
jgi:Protein of unknown function (DUF4236)